MIEPDKRRRRKKLMLNEGFMSHWLYAQITIIFQVCLCCVYAPLWSMVKILGFPTTVSLADNNNNDDDIFKGKQHKHIYSINKTERAMKLHKEFEAKKRL